MIFENEHLVLCDKDHGVLSVPAREADDPRPCLGRELQKTLGVQIYPVHRLDFEVSGLVLFAKTKEAHRAAQAWFEHGQVTKTYEAFSTQVGPTQWSDWHSRLAKGKRRAFEALHGKDSQTRARVIGSEGELFRWELVPVTGRPHQLRFEMAKHQAPILGDTLYGGREVNKPHWIALRAVALDFARVGERYGLPENLRISGLQRP